MDHTSWIGWFLLVASVGAQQQLNILLFHDEGDLVAKQGIDSAVGFLAKNPGQGVKVNKVYTMALKAGTDIEAVINATCNKTDPAIDEGQPPHIVLDTTKTGILSEAVKSFTRAMGYPTFSASYGQENDLREWRNLTAEEKKYLVQLMPPGDIMLQAIRDIAKAQNMTNAAILYDNSFVMDHKFKSLLQNLPTRHIIVMAESKPAQLRDQIQRLKAADIVNYFAVGTVETLRSILDAATASNIFSWKYSWYTMSKVEDELGCGCENSSIVHIQPSSTPEMKSRLNLLKGSYGLSEKPEVEAAFYYDFALRGILAAGLMAANGKYTDFKFAKCSSFDEKNPVKRKDFNLTDALKQVQVVDTWSKVIWGANGKSFPKIDLSLEKYTVLRGKASQRKPLGQWDAGMPGTLVFKPGMSLQDHQAVTVYRIVTVVQAPFMMKEIVDGKPVYSGYCVDLIKEIKAIMGFQYELYEAPDGKFGAMNENGDWNGMIKELVDKKADIALASMSVMSERENVIDFTVPYYDLVGITILMQKTKIPTSLFKFLTVLEAEVWVSILAAYVATSILLWIFDRFSPYSYQNNQERYKDDDEKRVFDLKECLWFCMTSLTPQGGGEAPKNLSGRLVAATWWLFGFIIIASYTANLAAFLTVSRLDTPIEGLMDLSTQYKIQYAPVNGSAAMTYFERMSYIEKRFYEIWKDLSLDDTLSPVERAKLAVWDYPVSDKYTKMWLSMQEGGLPGNFNDALARVRASKSASEGFAFIGDATDIKYQTMINCDLQIIGDEFSRKPYAIAVQQGSPLKDQFNDAILRLLNQRKLETLKERWWNRNPLKRQCDKEDDQSDGISIENIGGVFIVIFVGILLACFTLAFEYWWYKSPRARMTESGRVVEVKEKGYDKSHFNTDFRTEGFDIAPVPNPW